MNKEGLKPVYIGYGESEDPLPEKPQLTRYRVFAGPCRECGCAGRKLLPGNETLIIVCDKCQGELKTSILSSELSEVTYIYWCNSSKFSSDIVEMTSDEAAKINELIAGFEDQYEIPHWAVAIIGGRCCSSEMCVNFSCQYLVKSQ